MLDIHGKIEINPKLDDNVVFDIIKNDLEERSSDNIYIENNRLIFNNDFFALRANFRLMTILGSGDFLIDKQSKCIRYSFSLVRFSLAVIIFSVIVFSASRDTFENIMTVSIAFIICFGYLLLSVRFWINELKRKLG